MPETQTARLAELVKSALEREPHEWPSFLDRTCGGDVELRKEIESLLQLQEQAGAIMEKPALALAANILVRDRELKAEETIGPYEIISLIGRGGMGDVYLAQDRQLHREVALKIVRRGIDTDALVLRFRREEQILAGLNHPNIARLYGGSVTADELPYFVMEYVDGPRLDVYCEEKRLSVRERLVLFQKVCAAVSYAHQHLVIHRDIKTSNIRVTTEGEPKLLDFGIAKVLATATSPFAEQTMTFPAAMTPEWASPEQVRGETMTTASDIYSLGVLLYKMLTGQSPYQTTANRADEITRAILEDEPVRPSTTIARSTSSSEQSKIYHLKSLRGDLDNIILMALRKEPQRRYQSANQFSDDVRRHLEGLPVVARKDTWSYRSGKFVRRNKIAVAAAMLIALTLIGAVSGIVWQARLATEQAAVASQQRDLALRERSKAERINRFLQRMLSFSNQSVTSLSSIAQKKEVTVNAMLDQITPQVQTELANEPEVRAEVLRTIGSAYNSQGRYDRAEKNLRSALTTQMQLYGEENNEVAATMAELGSLYYNEAKYADANPLLEKAVAFYRTQRQTKSPQFAAIKLAQALDTLGVIKHFQGDSEAAISLLSEALQIGATADLHGNERAILASIKTDLGGVLVLSGEIGKGEPLLREALTDYREISSTPRAEVGVNLTMLGVCALDRKQPDEAETFLREGENIYRQTLGEANPYVIFNLKQQASALAQKSNLTAAIKKSREALAIAQQIAPVNKLSWIGAAKALADLLLKAGLARESEDYLRQALAISEQQTPPNIVSISRVKTSLSQSLVAQNRLAEAEKIARDSYDEVKRSLGAQSPLLQPTAANLIAIYEKEGKRDAIENLK